MVEKRQIIQFELYSDDLIYKFKLIFFHSLGNFQFMRMPKLISFSSETFKAEKFFLVLQLLFNMACPTCTSQRIGKLSTYIDYGTKS